MGIPMGIPVGMGWVWGLKCHPHGSPAKRYHHYHHLNLSTIFVQNMTIIDNRQKSSRTGQLGTSSAVKVARSNTKNANYLLLLRSRKRVETERGGKMYIYFYFMTCGVILDNG